MEYLYIFVILIILIIFYFLTDHVFSNSKRLYNQIDNDNDIDIANKYISSCNKFYRTPLENYRIGNIYDFVLRDNTKAHEYYLQAIDQIKKEPIDDALFIQTRLRDRVNINNIIEIDDNKYNLFNLDALDHELHDLELALTQLYTDENDNNKNRARYESKTLEDRVQWRSDSQNVHDSNINNELRAGYDQIKNENRDKFLLEIPDIENYIRHIYTPSANANELHNIKPALQMLDYIKTRGAYHIVKLETSEKDFISNVFTKIYNEKDDQKRKIMMENLMLNLKESYSGGSPVCITGRITRILTSFSDMDEENPTLGILKAKPVLRNEMLMKAADVRNKIYDDAPKNIQDKYDKSISDADTKALEDNIKQKIRIMIHKDYADLEKKDDKFIQSVIQEIEASI